MTFILCVLSFVAGIFAKPLFLWANSKLKWINVLLILLCASRATASDNVEVAVECDYPTYQIYGSVPAVINHVNEVFGAVNVQYERDVHLHFTLTSVIVHTDPANNYPSRCEWLNLHPDIPHDLYVQWRNDGLYVGGQANAIGNVGTIESFCTVTPERSEALWGMRQNELVAHEIGHLFNCQHDTDFQCTYTMCNGACAVDRFSPDSIAAITAFKATLTCLNRVSLIPPDRTPPVVVSFIPSIKGKFITLKAIVSDNTGYTNSAFPVHLLMDNNLAQWGTWGFNSWTIKLPDNKPHTFKVWAQDGCGNTTMSNGITVH